MKRNKNNTHSHHHSNTSDYVTRIGVSLPDNLLKNFDSIIEEKGYTTRSEAIRDAIRDYIEHHSLTTASKKEGISIISYQYDHSVRRITDELIHIQHHFYDQIITSQHIHMSHENCLEIVIFKGKFTDAHKLADQILALRGAKLVKCLDF